MQDASVLFSAARGSRPGMIVAVLQARCSSTRLPGKVLLPILGQPMLLRQIERVRRARRIDRLVVATSTEAADGALATLCSGAGIACYRGALDDVLDRVYRAAIQHHPDHVVRLTGDCPLADPVLIDEVVERHLEGGQDYTGNVLPPTYPDGLDVEVVRVGALEAAWREARRPSEREHVTPFIHTRRSRFAVVNVASPVDRSGLRWTVDEPGDFALVAAVYEALYPANPAFTTADILALLAARPGLVELNRGLSRNAGYERSLAADARQAG